MLLETLGAYMLGNILTGKRILRAGKGALKARRGYESSDNMVHIWFKIIWIMWIRILISAPSFKQHQDYLIRRKSDNFLMCGF